MKKDFRKMKEDYTHEEWQKMIKAFDSGEVVKIPEHIYFHFLEVLPPIYSKQTGFLLSEPKTHTPEGFALRMWFYGSAKTGYYAQLVNEKYHVKRADLITAGLM